MARKLKTYQTSLGFFDEAIAAPSMKAALEAWGTKTNLFHQGVAKEADDPDIIAATMRKPGVILKRPIGSNGPFKEHADLPTHLPGDEAKGKPGKRPAKLKEQPRRKIDDKDLNRPKLRKAPGAGTTIDGDDKDKTKGSDEDERPTLKRRPSGESN